MSRALSRLELVEQLLYTYLDARLPFRDVDGGPEGNRDSRLLLMSRDWNEGSYAELERVLGLMRERRHKRLNGHVLGFYRRQVLDWYMAPVKISYRPVWVTVPGGKRAKQLNEDGSEHLRPERVYVRPAGCEYPLAQEGAGWISERMTRVQLPPGLFASVAA